MILRMSDLHHSLIFPLFIILLLFSPPSCADIGTTSQYSPPYTPTACFGSGAAQFPSSNYFAAAGEGIWDNGASCGRQYLVSCISSVLPKACKAGQTIQIRIVDRAQSSVSKSTRPETTMVLSDAAFAAIADPSAPSLNIEFQQV
ncbi:PREDICTED: EG45-like domain containing protein [Ipomoea nil]|uniref:EG45-like domain containing protein n=1 Tax=Ipomoea nil TaxID=35883 RepID=UPI0009009CB9|nr:PREDICTED: EG45-like domain containing protein [Ipomoea nil]